MRSLIRKHLPELGVLGTADAFREKYIYPGYGPYSDRDIKLNREFCDLLEKVADNCPDGIYDPVYVEKALKRVK